MNASLLSLIWLPLLVLLAAEVALVVGFASLSRPFIKAAVWHRTIWQACILGVLGLSLLELTGTSREFAGWLGRRADRQIIDRTTPPSAAQVTASRAPAPQLTVEFRKQVEERLETKGQDPPLKTPEPASGSTAPHAASQPIPAASVPSGKLAAAMTIADQSVSDTPAFAAFALIRPAAMTIADQSVSDPLAVLWLGLGWMIGAGLVLTRCCFARCLFLAFRWRRRAIGDPALCQRVGVLAGLLKIKGQVRLVESGRLTGPIAFGLLRPTIGLPSGFTKKFGVVQQEAMLAHELAHLAGGDPFWYLLADVVAAILWWHPSVWWARRQLHMTSEAAADEASLLVVNGPGVLAECLVELGARIARHRPSVWLGVEGSGFRSALGRRVERLVKLQGCSWSPPSRLRSTLARTLGSAALVATAILCTAWAGPQAFNKGESMKTMKQTWKQSLAAFALLVTIEKGDGAARTNSKSTDNTAEPMVTKVYQLKYRHPTNLVALVKSKVSQRSQVIPDTRTGQLIVVGKEDELRDVDSLIAKLDNKPTDTVHGKSSAGAAEPLEKVYQPVVDIKATPSPAGKADTKESPRPSRYMYNRAMLERYGIPPDAFPQSAARKDTTAIEAKLEAITLEEVQFDSIPLAEVLRYLDEESRKGDPEKQGVNFLINPNGPPASAPPAIDPSTGTPIRTPPPEPIDMNSVIVRFNLPLRNVRLKDVLNAIVKVADRPIQYSVEEYGVVFSANDDVVASRAPTPLQANAPSLLQVRTFRVETNTFLAGLEGAFGITVSDLSSTSAPAERSKKIQATLRQLLAQLGIDMSAANKSVFYNDLTGIVMVRATQEDLNIVQAAIETLGGQSASVYSDGGSAGAAAPFYSNELMRRRYGIAPGRP